MNPYVPYDTSILTEFSNAMKGYIGISVPIAIICFAMVIGVALVVSIVRR